MRGATGAAYAVECAGPKYDRLLVAQRAVAGLARSLAEDHPPVYVLIEQPGGRTVEPQLWYSLGAAISGVVEGLELFGARPALDTIPVATWKKEAGLGGNADKPRVAEFARTAYGWLGGQDEADALTVATAAWRRFVAQVDGSAAAV